MHEHPPSRPRAPSSGNKPRAVALRFISGKYQGGEFPVTREREIVVGRSSDLDMVLVEDMVSRKHATIRYEGELLVIEDLGSTNGTFVNGEKIKRTRLKEGDRILIGTSILKVVPIDAASPTDAARPNLESVAAKRQVTSSRTMSGSIEEVPLPDLLQLFSTSKKTGVLVVRTDDAVGRIFLNKGALKFATIDESPAIPPMKAIFAMLTWTTGQFDLEPPVERELVGELDVSVQEILMESLRQIDELNALRDRLPAETAQLALATPLKGRLRELTPVELDVLQTALAKGRLLPTLLECEHSELETARSILKLVAQGFLRAD